jgi:hypothetical protein
VVGCFGKMSGTYWVIVIRPGLSRTATTVNVGYTSNRPSISVLNRSMHIKVSLVDDLTRLLTMCCKHWQTRSACSVDTVPLHCTGHAFAQQALMKRKDDTYDRLVLAVFP